MYNMAQKKESIISQICEGTELWAFTCKILRYPRNGGSEKDYEPFFKLLYRLTNVIIYCGEVDSKGKLHYHGVIRIQNNFYRKDLRIKGYHLYLKRVYRLRDWVDYCFKNNVLYCFEEMKNHKLH